MIASRKIKEPETKAESEDLKVQRGRDEGEDVVSQELERARDDDRIKRRVIALRRVSRMI